MESGKTRISGKIRKADLFNRPDFLFLDLLDFYDEEVKGKLHPKEKVLLERKRAKKRGEFLTGRHGLKGIICKKYSLPYEELCILNSLEEEDRGRPVLWVAGKKVNLNLCISHDLGKVMVAVSEQPMGADVVKVRRGENRRYMKWAVKEALVKAMGIGFKYGPASVSVDGFSLEGDRVYLSLCGGTAKCFEKYSSEVLFEYDEVKDYILMVCHLSLATGL